MNNNKGSGALLLALAFAGSPAFAQQPGVLAGCGGGASASASESRAVVEPLTRSAKAAAEIRRPMEHSAPERQQAFARGSQRWLNMSPEQRVGMAQQRFQQWHQLPQDLYDAIRVSVGSDSNHSPGKTGHGAPELSPFPTAATRAASGTTRAMA